MCCFLGFNNYVSLFEVRNGYGVLIFKLEEEEKPALLLLQALFVEDCFFASAAGLGCWLVVATPQVPFLLDGPFFDLPLKRK
jgi:hypothetical protein